MKNRIVAFRIIAAVLIIGICGMTNLFMRNTNSLSDREMAKIWGGETSTERKDCVPCMEGGSTGFCDQPSDPQCNTEVCEDGYHVIDNCVAGSGGKCQGTRNSNIYCDQTTDPDICSTKSWSKRQCQKIGSFCTWTESEKTYVSCSGTNYTCSGGTY